MAIEKLVGFFEERWAVIRPMLWSFLSILAIVFGCGFGAATLLYLGQIGQLREQINTQALNLGRYRVALGIDKGSQGAMVELTNKELREKALNIVSQVRGLCQSYDQRSAPIKPDLQSKDKAKSKQAHDKMQALALEVSRKYDKAFRVDRNLVNNEMSRRLDPKAAGAVVRIPLYDAETGAALSLSSLVGASGFGTMDVGLMCGAANETEQLAKLLPLVP